MRTAILVATVLVTAVELRAQVFSYECDSTPDEAGWELFQNFCDAEEWSDNGFLFQHVGSCRQFPGEGQQIDYTKALDDFLGVEDFFLWWVVSTDGDQSEIPFGGPVGLSTWNGGSVLYLLFIASDQVKFLRDVDLPIIFVDIEPDIQHSYYLELHGTESYALYIDGEVVDSGIPVGSATTLFPRVNMRAKSVFVNSTAIWQAIRWGQIPEDASFDFDSDEDVDHHDYYYVAECLGKTGPGIFGGPENDAGPGCRFADSDNDGDVDLKDIAAFQNAFTGEGG
ncbi:MAG: hypothetical protein IID36_14370 [Planctomycetes bacterium]|nr:hypothetical protein [Planctomycetota bacterium]